MTAEQKIRKYFDDHFLRQRPYAEKAHINEARFSRILNGRTKITADEAVRLSEALGLKLETLLHYGEEDKETE